MIKIENLTKYYGESCALDRISFEVHKGEILGLLGPNGAGKTTTLRTLTCYLRPTSGDVAVKGYPIREHALEIKKLVGYLPESAPLYPDMLVYDYLRFVSAVRGLAPDRREARIRELGDLCGLREVMHKPIHELSKGYKQRVGLAHAMMSDPEILVLDEPTSGLDPNQIIEIREIIRTIGKEKTVILSTHILSEAEATCDRVVIIHRGKIVADGATQELKERAGTDYLIHVSLAEGDFETLRGALEEIPEVRQVVRKNAGEGGLHFHLTCASGTDIRPRVYEVIRRHEWPLLEFYRETRTLETIFRELTQEH